MKLRELLESFNENPHDVDLYHWDYDEEYATMADLSMKDFTEKWLEKFRDVLDSEIAMTHNEGQNWISVFVKGVKRSHVEDLASSHAGYCSEENYKLWFTI